MSLADLRKIFDKKPAEKSGSIVPFEKDSLFPYSLIDNKYLPDNSYFICFVSLSCAICVDVLPDIEKINNFPKESFLLVTDGEDEENFEIINHFKYSFQLISFPDSFLKFNVPSTPFVYFVSRNHYVIDYTTVESVEDIHGFIIRHME